MSERPRQQRTEHPADLYRGVYSQPYHEIVQPGRVWTAGKYFLRRWSAYLTPAEMWLVIGARQLSYLNRRRSWFSAYDSALAAAAGLNVDVYRRTVKRAIAGQEGYIAAFLTKQADPAYVVRDDVPRKGRTRYTVRLDDPLTPADATALAQWLQARLAPDAGEAQAIAALQEARRLEPQALWAQDLAPPEAAPSRPMHTVEDVVRHVLPCLPQSPAGSQAAEGWQAAAGALQTHLVSAEHVHLEPHYFREQWLPALGPGPALLIVTLRSLCYHNEETGEIRDVVRTEANALAQQLQTTTRTLRRWFKKLERAAAHDHLFGPFFTFLESSKQPDQRVIATYRLNLKMPLTPEDLARYRAATTGSDEAPPSNGSGADLKDKKSVTSRRGRQKVPDKSSVTGGPPASVPDKKSATKATQADKTSGTLRGGGQKVGNAGAGDGQNVGASQTKGRRFKYYERLLTALNLKDFAQLEQSTEQQYQHLWRLRDGQATAPLAAVAAAGSLPALLDLLGIHEPARSRIVQRDPPLAELLAWRLYSERQSNLDQPLGYVVARLLAGDAPPQPFLDLASLSWEQWRAYAALATLAPASILDQAGGYGLPLFDEWLALYGGVSPERLPFEVGQGLSHFRIEETRESDDDDSVPSPPMQGSTPDAPQNGALAADRALWQETLAELSLQMTQSTFDAWLREARFVCRDGDAWTIAVASPAAQSWLQNRLCPVVERTLGSVVGQPASVRFVVEEG